MDPAAPFQVLRRTQMCVTGVADRRPERPYEREPRHQRAHDRYSFKAGQRTWIKTTTLATLAATVWSGAPAPIPTDGDDDIQRRSADAREQVVLSIAVQ
uniref:Uncharacterized protein n=1 Tax=Sinorhizobium meliloti (strain SM11) TaxID=707241 RepID=Q1WLC8_SINMM|nr:hypothetical protein [Sinorhizobium meliloti]